LATSGARPYRLLYTRQALADIEKLDAVTKKRLGKKLQHYADGGKPLEHARKLVSPEIGTYRFRAGDYRVVFDVSGLKLIVLRVGHRSDIYRR
jgi:mRNA interferase RelE/StbE